MGDAAWLLLVAAMQAALEESCPGHVDVVQINRGEHVMIVQVTPEPESAFFAICVPRSRVDAVGPLRTASEFLKRLRANKAKGA